jgi:hypothetical protein
MTLVRDPSAWGVVSNILTEDMFTEPEARRAYAAVAAASRLPAVLHATAAWAASTDGHGTDTPGPSRPLRPAELREAALRLCDCWVHRVVKEIGRSDDARADGLIAQVWAQIARVRAAYGAEPATPEAVDAGAPPPGKKPS